MPITASRADTDPVSAAHEAFGLRTDIVDELAVQRTVDRFRAEGVILPTFAELAQPSTIPAARIAALEGVDRSEPDARNLFRVHWYNHLRPDGGTDPTPAPVPDHLELPPELTGVEARIVLALGNRFPMIGAHKVLAAYACLVPRLVTGRFDPSEHRAVWPSTGNYARGGVAISRILGCRGVAVLPAGMSQARFDWLERWTLEPERDIIRTPGTESNVKEIYDTCAVLETDPTNAVINQFSEFANHLGHRLVTGPALERVFEHVTADTPSARLAAFVSASGSAGTLGAGNHLAARHGCRVVAAEALECPTLLENGFGEHNIQGIGDKHVPLIHDVFATDDVVAVSDRSTDALDALFNTPAGRAHLVDRVGVAPEVVDALVHLGYSSICNVLAAIAVAKAHGYGREDVIVTVATDGSEMYDAERRAYLEHRYPDGFGPVEAAEVYGRELASADTARHLELTDAERRRIFNLGYFTWVEQQGVPVADFSVRRHRRFWDDMVPFVDAWDELIAEVNARTGLRGDE
ncbi:MAG: pyridoxal-phosphate dependent enzyme [Actinomyces sp.]|nr:MAG: pyridoxal-phosphate dependent enzyme [Actinomyces sp.]